MQISVLIPCHNAEKWIVGAVESALAQNGPGVDVEVIVVDDGSIDRSPEALDSFGSRIRWERAPHLGAPSSRNRLLALARSEWVQYLDADDYLEEGKIARQLVELAKAPETDVIYGPVTMESYFDGRMTERAVSTIPEPHDPWLMLALWRLPQTGSPLWRKSALLDVGGWTVDQPCCQEHELYLRLLIAGKAFHYTPAGGAVYRRFSGSTLSTRNMTLVRGERLKIEKRLEDHLRDNDMLTPERAWAINQARFDMARSAWAENRDEARTIHAAISTPRAPFRPVGPNAPLIYRIAYAALGFEAAERIAEMRRGLAS